MAAELNRIEPYRQGRASIFTAALAGLVASVPMALVMMGLNRYLPHQRGLFSGRPAALPPKQITRRVARKAGAEEIVRPGRAWGLTTWLAHLGYGAAAASLFPLATGRIPLPAMVRGMLYGMAIWTGSYQGWLPAARILPPASEQPGRRNVVMILSHIVWGSLIGLLVKPHERGMQEDFTI
jgi:putative membrane protein